MTPEGEVKKAVKTYLEAIGCLPSAKADGRREGIGYYFMPVMGIGGVSGIPDFVGHYRGFFFAIEAKEEKKNPTPLQALQIDAINRTGGKAFVVRGEDDLGEVMEWVETTDVLFENMILEGV